MSKPLKLVLTLICFIVLVVALVALAPWLWRGPSAVEWVARYGADAERYALASLSAPRNSTPEPPQTLSRFKIERGIDFVCFCEPSGPFASSGYAYSTSGHNPLTGLGGESRVTEWRHVSGHWYAWTAD